MLDAIPRLDKNRLRRLPSEVANRGRGETRIPLDERTPSVVTPEIWPPSTLMVSGGAATAPETAAARQADQMSRVFIAKLSP